MDCGTTSPDRGRPSPATARATRRAIRAAPYSWKCVLSCMPEGKFGYCPGASHRNTFFAASVPIPSR